MPDDVQDVIATVPHNRSKDVRVALSESRGTSLVDVRTFTRAAQARDGDPHIATRKGVSLNVAHLPALIDALQDAAAVALRRGLIKSPGEHAAQPTPWWNRD